MLRIHVNRDRQNLGQFTPEEVAAGLASGRFLPIDLAWREGMEAWQPLEAFTDLPAPSPAALAEPSPGGPDFEAAPPAELTPPWEQDKPFVARAIATVQAVMFSPVKAFANLSGEDNYLKPLSFFVLVSWPAVTISTIYQAILQSVSPKAGSPVANLGPTILIAIYAGLVVFMPLLLTIGSFFGAGIYHLMLKLIGAAKQPFATTFRVVCYANGSTSILLVIPFCGGIIQLFWNLYALIIGLREAHRITTLNAVTAVLLPVILCCGVGLGGAVLLGGFAAAEAGIHH